MEFFSQVRQDAFLFENYFRGKRHGVFVDVGAYDGRKFSNSLFFERTMGWTGLCVEPIPSAFAALTALRKAKCANVCVSDFEGETDFLECEAGVDEKMLSGMKDMFDPRHVERVRPYATRSVTRKVQVRKLSNLLAEHNLYHVDYCSIDTEGSEISILRELDLERFHISVFTVENNYNDPALAELMASKGYDLVAKLDHDDVYCRRDVKRLARTSAICAVWHGDPDREALLRGHAANLARQTVPVSPIYVFDNGDQPPADLAGRVLCVREKLTIYQAWNVALSLVETPLVMNLNLDDRLAPDAVEQLENLLMREQAAVAGGDWKICYSQQETDAVADCYPAERLPVTTAWPPVPGSVVRLGSGTSPRGNLGPATIWRMDAHVGVPRYPWRFSEGSPIRSVGDLAWWGIVEGHLRRKISRLPLVIGNYHSHPGDQAEFRDAGENEPALLSELGMSLL